MADVLVRPIRDDEVELWVEIHNAVDPDLAVDAERVRRDREREPTVEDLIGFVDRRPAGAATAAEQADRRASPYAFAWIGVLPDARRRGLGSALYAAASAHARLLGKTGLQLDLWGDDRDGLDFFRGRGFAEAERFDRVRLDLAAVEAAAPPPPAGIELTTLAERPDLVAQMFEIHREAIADVPAAEPYEPDFEGWRAWEVERPVVRHDLTFFALAGDELAGYASLFVRPGASDGWHGWTAVRRRWRRRGIGLALKRTQIAAAKRVGLTGLVTFNEDRNEPIRRLNARLGYRPLAPQLRMRGPLAS